MTYRNKIIIYIYGNPKNSKFTITITIILTSCPEKIISTFCQDSSVESFWLMKYFRWSLSRAINSVPGVIQLESNRGSDGKSTPLEIA